MGGGDEADDEDFSMSSDEGSSSGSDQEATVVRHFADGTSRLVHSCALLSPSGVRSKTSHVVWLIHSVESPSLSMSQHWSGPP